MKGLSVRHIFENEIEAYCAMRLRLWPEGTMDEFKGELDQMLKMPEMFAMLVCVTKSGEMIGFIELARREESTELPIRRIGYIEGWYVEPEYRKKGVGRVLVVLCQS